MGAFLSTSGNVSRNAILLVFLLVGINMDYVMHNVICFLSTSVFLYLTGLVKFNFYTILLMPNLIIVFLTNLELQILSIIITRFRDVQEFIKHILMITINFWKPEILRTKKTYNKQFIIKLINF